MIERADELRAFLRDTPGARISVSTGARIHWPSGIEGWELNAPVRAQVVRRMIASGELLPTVGGRYALPEQARDDIEREATRFRIEAMALMGRVRVALRDLSNVVSDRMDTVGEGWRGAGILSVAEFERYTRLLDTLRDMTNKGKETIK